MAFTSPPTLPYRGTFYQGYLCTRCGVGAHKECLEVMPPCKISEYQAPPGLSRGQPWSPPHPELLVPLCHVCPLPTLVPCCTARPGEKLRLREGTPYHSPHS
jgi:guanine nucleotide exchange factor VAV